MRFVLTSAKKDLKRWARDPGAIALWLLIPLMIGALVTALMGGDSGPRPSGLLLIADEDQSTVSQILTGAYGQDEIGELIVTEQITRDEGRARIDAGEGSALLIIPAGFGDAFLEDRPVTLTLITNPAQTILPAIIEETTRAMLNAGFYIQRIFGEELATINALAAGEFDIEGGVDPAATGALAGGITERINDLAPYLFPFALDVEIVKPEPEEGEAPAKQVPLALLFLPGILMMSAFFAAQSLSGDIWQEQEQGALRRLAVSPRPAILAFAGKTAAAAVLLLALVSVALAIGLVYHGLPAAKIVPSALWLALSGSALFLGFAAIQLALPSRRAGTIVTNIIMFPLLMAGGSFFPLATMPDWLAAVGRLSPNGFMVAQLTEELVRDGLFVIPAASWFGLTAAAGGLFLLAGWRLQRVARR
ncbi:MAG: ABC transporter permease [Sphingomonadales bacterium]|nr:ABC transporter permease [Sphingomonadales bacterium]